MASCFGATASVAAFLVAFRFAHLLRRVLGEGALQASFIPLYEKFRKDDSKRAAQFFLDLKASLIVVLCTIVVLGSLLIYFFGYGENCLPLRIFIAKPSFHCLYGINASLLQCHNHYFVPSVAPVAFTSFG